MIACVVFREPVRLDSFQVILRFVVDGAVMSFSKTQARDHVITATFVPLSRRANLRGCLIGNHLGVKGDDPQAARAAQETWRVVMPGSHGQVQRRTGRSATAA